MMAGVLLLAGMAGCQDVRKQACKELARRGVPPTPAALQEAVRQNHPDLLEFFGPAGVMAEVPAPGEPSLLHLAVGRKDWPLVLRLMSFCGPEVVNHAGPSSRVVLEEVVLADQFPLAMKLLEAGALPALAAAGPDELVRHAAPDSALRDFLLEKLPAGHEALGPALWRAVAAGEKDRVERLIAHQAPAGAVSGEGKGSALEVACERGFLEIASLLMAAGARPVDSPAALGHAVRRHDLALARLLLQGGAKVDQPIKADQPEATALKASLLPGRTNLVKLMLEYGADRGICQDHAFAAGDHILLDLLLEQGLAFDRPGPDGNPPLVRAAVAGQTALIAKLLQKGARLEQTGVLGQTAYHMAVIHRHNAAMEILLAAGARPDDPFRKPAPPELIPLFGSDYFAKWYQRDEGLTPLMLAAARGDTAQLRQLLKAGAKRGAQTKAWHRYPIVFACDCVQIPAAQILLGRDPDTETDRRYAVVSLSRQRVTLFRNDQPVRSARVSTGKQSTPTPAGKYIITDKQADWVSSIYKVSMPFFMRLSCKEIGLHAGMVPGYPASHGCIRMPKGDVQAFFKLLKIGDPVTIEP